MVNFSKSAYRMATSPFRMLPSFIIPGETKCGTTTFYRALTQHPAIAECFIKEPNNFIKYGGTSFFCRMNYPVLFAHILSPGRYISGEASVEYLSKKDVPQAIFSLIPDVKFIVLLRNPVARAISDYAMMKDAGVELEDFDTVVDQSLSWLRDKDLVRLVSVATEMDAPPLRYITKGCYSETLLPWLHVFPRDNFLFIKSENFFATSQEVLNGTFKFLGLPNYTLQQIPHLRKSRRPTPMREATLVKLYEFFQPYNVKLSEIIGAEFNWENESKGLMQSSKS